MARADLMRFNCRSKSQHLLVEGDGNERSSHAALDARASAEIEAEFGEYAADAAGLGIVILRQRIHGGALALLHPIERCLQARERAADSARALGEDAGARIDSAHRDRAE